MVDIRNLEFHDDEGVARFLAQELKL